LIFLKLDEPMTILSLHYLPCIEWFRVFLSGEEAVIDIHEHFSKQTYRNRAVILSANGKLSLTVPIKKEAHHMVMATVKIDNEVKWQHQHWQAIVSAYHSAPYFLYYQDYFKPLYEREFSNLVEWNQTLLNVCLKLMKLTVSPVYSQQYLDGGLSDFRNSISPKVRSEAEFKPYLQVFSEKFPFEPNLSIIDMLFNHGPRWEEFL
jgi:hypothetical protein